MESNLADAASPAGAAPDGPPGSASWPIQQQAGAAGAPSPHAHGAGRLTEAEMSAAERAVTDLYEAHALQMLRLARLILGNRPGAEDVVQEAFYGLYRRWPKLSDPAKAVPYLRTSVVNGCRSALRRRWLPQGRPVREPDAVSAEAAVLSLEERRHVARALRSLPRRQQEALVLRFYLGLSAEESAAAMHISTGTVRSAISRGLASLHRILEETS